MSYLTIPTEWTRVLIVKKYPPFIEPKVHYRIHKNAPPDRILSQVNPVHTFTPYLCKIHFNIILPSTPKSPKWLLPFRFSD